MNISKIRKVITEKMSKGYYIIYTPFHDGTVIRIRSRENKSLTILIVCDSIGYQVHKMVGCKVSSTKDYNLDETDALLSDCVNNI